MNDSKVNIIKVGIWKWACYKFMPCFFSFKKNINFRLFKDIEKVISKGQDVFALQKRMIDIEMIKEVLFDHQQKIMFNSIPISKCFEIINSNSTFFAKDYELESNIYKTIAHNSTNPIEKKLLSLLKNN